MTIEESMKMGILTLQELFGNLEEHEMKLKRLSKNNDDKRKENLAPKVTTIFEEENDDLKSLEDLNENDDSDLLILTSLMRNTNMF